MGAEPNWQELGRLVRERRDAMGLRQSDVPSRGGPSLGTVQNIEQAVRSNYAPRTLRQLERALSAPDGWVDRILDGTATEDDLNPNRRFVRAGAAHASLGGLTTTVKGAAASATDSIPVSDTADAVARTEAEVARARDEMTADLAGSAVIARMSDAAVYAAALQRAVQRSGEQPFDDLARALLAVLQELQSR